MSRKPLVYLASPYTHGQPATNVHFQCKMFDLLFDDGVVTPHVPLWNHFQHVLSPRPEADWFAYDNEMLVRMDAVLRLAATHSHLAYLETRSNGADAEVELALANNIPVFYDVQALYAWAKSLAGPVDVMRRCTSLDHTGENL